MDELFIFLGKITFYLAVILTICCVWHFIIIGVNKLCWRYKYKHRFDKKPIAKCYCTDCKYHGLLDDNTFCQLHYKNFPSDWFCKDAKPKDKE